MSPSFVWPGSEWRSPLNTYGTISVFTLTHPTTSCTSCVREQHASYTKSDTHTLHSLRTASCSCSVCWLDWVIYGLLCEMIDSVFCLFTTPPGGRGGESLSSRRHTPQGAFSWQNFFFPFSWGSIWIGLKCYLPITWCCVNMHLLPVSCPCALHTLEWSDWMVCSRHVHVTGGSRVKKGELKLLVCHMTWPQWLKTLNMA